MMRTEDKTRMTEGSISRKIILFAIPLFLGNLFQQLYNTADSLIVGNYLGSNALAAVSSSGNLIFLMVGFINGIAMGAGVVIARYYGAKDRANLEKSIHTTVAFGIAAGIALTVIGMLLAPKILVLMGTPAEVLPDIEDKKDAVELKDVKGDITFENVSFQYEENTENVLNHISLNVPAGAYMALVGSSGAGKSTLCSLIPRFYDVTGGAVKIDGKDVRDLTLKSLRDHIGIVQQDVYLFVGTVFDNIRYGKPDATREEVIEAAKNANAHEFIMSLPNGYETDIGQRGIKLSGGQKQRLSIARVFLKNPPILIFDEATSALDNESEKRKCHRLR